MDISKFTSRDEIASLIPNSAVGVELGVAAGRFSEKLLRKSQLSLLYSIDAWAGDRGHDEAEQAKAEELLKPYGARSKIIKSRFSDAVKLFDDGYFDFIYIDGYAHTGQEMGKTHEEWWPKLKAGGIFSGDDYSEKYPKVIEFVDKFAEKHNLELHIIKDWNGHHSWVLFRC